MYDPVAPLERLRCPVLALYGDIDIHVPTKKSIGILKQALDRANNRDYTIKSYPDSGHELSPPGLDEHVAEWLLERVRVGS
jgi:dipeptidyl aminopeptidase/acylaminoacyl peptidase